MTKKESEQSQNPPLKTAFRFSASEFFQATMLPPENCNELILQIAWMHTLQKFSYITLVRI